MAHPEFDPARVNQIAQTVLEFVSVPEHMRQPITEYIVNSLYDLWDTGRGVGWHEGWAQAHEAYRKTFER